MKGTEKMSIYEVVQVDKQTGIESTVHVFTEKGFIDHCKRHSKSTNTNLAIETVNDAVAYTKQVGLAEWKVYRYDQVFISFQKAIQWLNGNYIQVPSKVELLDKEVFELVQLRSENEICQYYMVDWTQTEVEYMQKRFTGFNAIAYSNVLDMYILGIDHCGTSWNYVEVEVLEDDLAETIVFNKDYMKETVKEEV